MKLNCSVYIRNSLQIFMLKNFLKSYDAISILLIHLISRTIIGRQQPLFGFFCHQMSDVQKILKVLSKVNCNLITLSLTTKYIVHLIYSVLHRIDLPQCI